MRGMQGARRRSTSQMRQRAFCAAITLVLAITFAWSVASFGPPTRAEDTAWGRSYRHRVTTITRRKRNGRASRVVLDLNARSTQGGMPGRSSSSSPVAPSSMKLPKTYFMTPTSAYRRTGQLRAVRPSDSSMELSFG